MNHPAAAAPKVRKHLMVPGQVRAPTPTDHSTVMVQRWVITVLTVSIVFHLAAGLVIAACFVDPRVSSSRIGLLIIAGVMGCLAVGGAFAMHRRSVLTPWLAAGLLPSLVGVYLCFVR